MKMKPLFNLLCLFFTKCLSACLVAGFRPGVARPTTSVSKCLTLCLCAFVPLCLPSCQQGITPFPLPVVSLSVLDAGVTDVLLELKVANDDGKQLISVERDGKEIRCLACADDSLFYDDNLQPNRSYSYRAFLMDGGEKIYGTPEVNITTMDTTSNDFEWQTFTFGGQGASCTLYDVAIINENDIWAVGEIHTEETDRYDSLGNWIDPYNAVHWERGQWKLYRFKFYDFCNQQSMGIYPAYTVLAFNPNDIYFSSGSQITKYDGLMQLEIECILLSINKLWGINNRYLFAAGAVGKLGYYMGVNWHVIISGTDLPIKDIWGSKNSISGQTEILCTASSPFETIGKKIIQIENYAAKTLSDSGISDWVSSVWFMAGRKYYVAGSGIYVKNRLTDPKWINVSQGISNYYIYSIRGNDINDIVAAGGCGEILHFNGLNWKSFYNETRLGYGNYYSLVIKDNLVAAVGSDYRAAVIIIGKRN